MCPARRNRNPRSAAVSAEDQPQRPRIVGASVEIRGFPCGQPAAAGARRTKPRSGKNPRGAQAFCRVVVPRGAAATEGERDRSPVAARGAARKRRNILTTSAQRTHCGRGLPVPVPEGRRRRLAGGKSAPADAAPGNRAAWLRAPTGHRRKWPEATSGGGNAAGRTPPKNSSMPRWGMARSAAQPGAAPAARACPRLISCGVPLGRRAKRRQQFFGRRPAARAAQNPRVRRGFFPERGCVRGAPAAAGWLQGTPRIPTVAGEVSGPLRLVLGGHSRTPWVAAPPLCVHRISVVLLPLGTA